MFHVPSNFKIRIFEFFSNLKCKTLFEYFHKLLCINEYSQYAFVSTSMNEPLAFYVECIQ